MCLDRIRWLLCVLLFLAGSAAAQQPVMVLPFPVGDAYRCSQGPGGNTSHNIPATQYDFDFAIPASRDVTAAADGIAYVHFGSFSRCGKQCVGGSEDGHSCTGDSQCPDGACRSGNFGNHVNVNHGNGLFTVYGHLESFAVNSGQAVVAGQKIGTADNSGYSCGNHLHFGLHSGTASANAISSTSVQIERIAVRDRTADAESTASAGSFSSFSCGVATVGHVYESVPSLTIATDTCAEGVSCAGVQSTMFHFRGRGFRPGGLIRRFMRDSTGTATELPAPPDRADSYGRVNWSFLSSCSAVQPDTFTLYTVDLTTGRESNRVTETVTPGTCPPPPPPGDSLDPTFGVGGKMTTDVGGVGDSINAAALQLDGKIVVAGVVYRIDPPPPCCPTFVIRTPQFAVARYNTDGSLDTGFGAAGKVIIAEFQQADAIVIQPDGKIIVAGIASCCSPSIPGGPPVGAALVRLNTDGSFDSSFGLGGKLTTTFLVSGLETFPDFVSLAIQPDGRILAAGEVFGGTATQFDFLVARFNSNGSLDMTFGMGGKVATDIAGGLDQAEALVLQSDGNIILGGISRPSATSPDVFTLVRYTATGVLDTSFGMGGKVTTDFGGSFAHLFSLALHSDGRIVAAGRTRNLNTGNDVALARYNVNGTLDPTFGTGGRVVTDFFGSDDSAVDVAIQQDWRIVVVGHASRAFDAASADFAVLRYRGDGVLDPTFGSNGKVLTDFFGFSDQARAVVIDANGDIVAAGSANRSSQAPPDPQDFALARYRGGS